MSDDRKQEHQYGSENPAWLTQVERLTNKEKAELIAKFHEKEDNRQEKKIRIDFMWKSAHVLFSLLHECSLQSDDAEIK